MMSLSVGSLVGALVLAVTLGSVTGALAVAAVSMALFYLSIPVLAFNFGGLWILVAIALMTGGLVARAPVGATRS